MNGYPLDHVAVAVASIQEAKTTYEHITGAVCSPIQSIPEQGVNVAFVGQVELIEPINSDGPVARFIQKKGEGLHHIAYTVEDILAELNRIAAQGFQIIDPEPRSGANGHLVAFLHPKSTGGILIELVQH